MSSFHNSEAVVIDNGTGFLKAGFAGEDSPQVVVPTTTNFLQKIQLSHKMNANGNQDENDGNTSSGNSNNGEGSSNSNNSNHSSSVSSASANYKKPIRRGTIEDWESMTAAWRYLLHHELGVDPESPEFPVVLTDSPLASRQDREKMAEIMFETFNVPGLYVGSQAVFSLYASGRTRGLVLEIGDGVTHSVPIFEGFALPHATNRMDLAGGDLTTMIRSRLAERGISFSRSEAHATIVRNIKESLCCVSMNYEEESKASESTQYELPDGQVVTVDSETKYGIAETLFNPTLFPNAKANGVESGVVDLMLDSIRKCDGDLQPDLCGNIVLSGGSSMFPGLRSRMLNELRAKMDNDDIDINIITDSQRKYSAWIGGSMFGSLGTFGDIQYTRQEYNDGGASSIHRKCF